MAPVRVSTGLVKAVRRAMGPRVRARAVEPARQGAVVKPEAVAPAVQAPAAHREKPRMPEASARAAAAAVPVKGVAHLAAAAAAVSVMVARP